MQIQPCLKAEALRLLRKNTVRGIVAWRRLEQIVGTAGTNGLGGLLRIVAVVAQIRIGETRHNALAVNGCNGGSAHKDLAALVVSRPIDSFRRHFGFKDRRHRLRMARQPSAAPAELRRIHGRQVNYGYVYVAAIVNELAP